MLVIRQQCTMPTDQSTSWPAAGGLCGAIGWNTEHINIMCCSEFQLLGPFQQYAVTEKMESNLFQDHRNGDFDCKCMCAD